MGQLYTACGRYDGDIISTANLGARARLEKGRGFPAAHVREMLMKPRLASAWLRAAPNCPGELLLPDNIPFVSYI